MLLTRHVDFWRRIIMVGPLKGVKVLDLSSVVMGPYATLMMADMGGDVIKVERPAGDITRYVGPSRNEGMGSNFLNLNRNKRSIVLDLKSEEDFQSMINLVKKSDVLIRSFRPQTMKKLGLSYKDIIKVNKSIVYCGMFGYGQEGPYASNPAYDDLIQAGSGTAAAQGEIAGEPQYVASLLADKTTGLIGLSALLSALIYKEKTGEGQEVEVPMFESMASNTLIEHLYGETFSPPIGEHFYARATTPYRKPYKTSDGYLGVLIYNDKQWKNFLHAIGRDDLMEDERFNNITGRSNNSNVVNKFVNNIMGSKTTNEWIQFCEEQDIPYMPVNSPKDLMEDEHMKSVDFFTKEYHPTEGEITNIKFPVNFSKTSTEIKR